MTAQKENGYTAIANELMEALAKYPLPGAQTQCLFLILRKTYGYHKKWDSISLSQFEKGTGITRRNVSRALDQLKKKNIIHVKKGGVKNDTISVSKYRFNKGYKSWKGSVKIAPGSVKYAQKVVSNMTHTKDIITKDIYKYLSPEVCDFTAEFVKHISESKGNLAPKSKNLKQKSAETVDKLIRIDGFSLGHIKDVLRWALKDNFWADNVLSLASLRTKKNGLTKFQNISNKYQKAKGGNNGKGQRVGKGQNYTKPDTRQSAIPTKRPDYSTAV